jgi:predicted Zn-dependent protease
MKYQPSLPRHNDNVSDEHPLKDFVLILAGLSLAVLVLVWALGLAVDAVVDNLSPETEARLTRLMAPDLPKSPALDATLRAREAWAQSLVDGMRRCAGVSEPVTLRLVASKDANAVVLPGGNIILYAGLFQHVRSENGMAFVLAHELSHLIHRDHLRGLGRSLVIVAAATVLTGDGSWAAGVLAPAQHLGESHYSRGRESAADARALAILQCRYGHVGGATEFFSSMRSKDEGTPAFAHYLASHPSAASRIDALQAEIRRAGYRIGEVGPIRP